MALAKEQSTRKSIRDRLLALLFRLTPTERQRLLALTILSGGLCGLAAVAFHVGIDKASVLLIDREPRPLHAIPGSTSRSSPLRWAAW